MNKPKTHTLSINMDLSEDYSSCRCTCGTTVTDQKVLGALLASAVVAIAHDYSRDLHAFAKAVTDTVMEFIDKPGFTKPKEQLS
jgi:hypothetical protein